MLLGRRRARAGAHASKTASSSTRSRVGAWALATLVTGALTAVGSSAWADVPSSPAESAPESRSAPLEQPLDGTAVRYFAPETGGAMRPQFLTHRVLAFQAFLEAKIEDAENVGTQERHLRAAIERLVVEGVVSALPMGRSPDAKEIGEVVALLRAGLAERIGGADVIDKAAQAQGLAASEVQAIFARRARAALYADRSLTPIFNPTEEQLREVFRTASHPFRGRRFEEVKTRLASWYVDERLRVSLSAFLQSARARIRIVPIR